MTPHRLERAVAPRGPLHGLGIVVTRPPRQAAALAQKLATLGATPIVFPAIVILPPDDRSALDEAHARLHDYDFAVFVSANAVEYGAPSPQRWPRSLVALAPGASTADVLVGAGIDNVLASQTTQDSEGLLALPALADVRGRRIVIFRGERGREHLGTTLRERGAHVDVVCCYRRVAPATDAGGLVEALVDGRAHAFTVTSREGIDNLWSLLGARGREASARLPWFAQHPRIAEHARTLGLQAIETGPGDGGLIAGLLEWVGSGVPLSRFAPDT